ncbi:MAG: hypothetical protein H8D45_29415 [Bacteroidetes bacterium]|nr:hypothetical protein [Bacteroidota bacterium]
MVDNLTPRNSNHLNLKNSKEFLSTTFIKFGGEVMKTIKNLSLSFVLVLCLAILLAMFSGCCTLFPRGANCPPKPAIFPTSLDFRTDLNSMIFSIRNDGGGNIEWQAIKDKPWITLSQTNGRITTETASVEVTVDRSAIDSGTHNGEVQVNTNTGSFKVVISMTKEPPPVRLQINFSSLYINDDDEIGEGDWRILCKVNGEQVVWISKYEAGTGESVPINRTFNTKPEWNRVEVFCKVHEQDGSEWEYFAEGTHVYERIDNYTWKDGTFGSKTFYWNTSNTSDEGIATLKYSINPLNE